jgi:hypothetical protein
VRFFLASLAEEAWTEAALAEWEGLAATDEVGRHRLTDDPLSADRIVFVDLHQHPHDPFLKRLADHPLVRARPASVRVYDQRDRPVRTLSGVYVSGARLRAPDPTFRGGPYPRLHTAVGRSPEEPDLLWSFAGARTHPVRDSILRLRSDEAVTRDTSSVPMFSASADDRAAAEQARAEYRLLLSRSAFVLCPRGHGPSSYRLFETLAAGRVPVVVSDRWLPPPRIDWQSCSVRVAERDVAHIPRILDSLQPEWTRLSTAASQVWERHFAPPRMWDHLAQSLADSPPRALRRGPTFRSDAARLRASLIRRAVRARLRA